MEMCQGRNAIHTKRTKIYSNTWRDKKAANFQKGHLEKEEFENFLKKKINKISGETLIRDLKVPRPEFILIDLTELILNWSF